MFKEGFRSRSYCLSECTQVRARWQPAHPAAGCVDWERLPFVRATDGGCAAIEHCRGSLWLVIRKWPVPHSPLWPFAALPHPPLLSQVCALSINGPNAITDSAK